MMGAGGGVRLAELVAALSLATDLGLGQPQEHIIRQTVVAMRMGELDGLSDDELTAIFYVSLLAWVGCVADAHEMAKWFGDDIAAKALKYEHEMGGVRGALVGMRLIGAGNPPLHRFRVGLEFAFSGHREVNGMIADWTRQHSKHEAMEIIGAAGIPAGAVLDTMELSTDPSFEQRGIMPVIDHPVNGKFKMVAWPVRFSGSPPPVTPSPLLGQNNEDVLGSWLGLDSGTVGGLKAGGVIG